MNRRQFLRDAALAYGAGGLLLSQGSRAADAPSRSIGQASEFEGMQLAVACICLDGFGNERHEPTFRLAPQTGIRNMEFNLWYPDLLIPGYIDSIGSRCAANGLTPISLQGSSFGGDGRNAVIHDLSHKLWLMEQARRLGCRRVKFTGARRGTSGGLEHVIAVCRELAPAAEEMDVLVLLENHAGNVLERPEDYDAIFDAVDSTHIGMCLDTGHFEGVGIPLDSVVEAFHSKTLHVDLKDCAAFDEGHNTVVFGKGVTDFDAFLEQLASHGYNGYLVIEMAWPSPRQPVVDNLIAARERFAPYVANP